MDLNIIQWMVILEACYGCGGVAETDSFAVEDYRGSIVLKSNSSEGGGKRVNQFQEIHFI